MEATKHPPYTITINANLKNLNFKFKASALSLRLFWSSIQSQYTLIFKISPRFTLGIDSKKGVLAVQMKKEATLKSKFFKIWKKATSLRLLKKKNKNFRNEGQIDFSRSLPSGMIRHGVGILIKNNLFVILVAVVAYLVGCSVSYLNFWSLKNVKEIFMEVVFNHLGV
ncbi:hypothetical protein ACHQM5_008573 [Ranunculus cassubicifolius]